SRGAEKCREPWGSTRVQPTVTASIRAWRRVATVERRGVREPLRPRSARRTWAVADTDRRNNEWCHAEPGRAEKFSAPVARQPSAKLRGQDSSRAWERGRARAQKSLFFVGKCDFSPCRARVNRFNSRKSDDT